MKSGEIHGCDMTRSSCWKRGAPGRREGNFFFLCVVAEGGTVRFSSSAEDLGLELCKED